MTSPALLLLTLAAFEPEFSVAPLGPLVPANEFRDQVSAAAWGEDAIVAWRDGRFGQVPVVMVSTVFADGGLATPQGLFTGVFNAWNPQVGTNGPRAIVVWEANSDVWYRVLANTGAWLTPPTRLASGRCPSIAFGPGGGIIAFEQGHLKAVRLLGDGSLLDAMPIDLTTTNVAWGTCSRAASDGDALTQFLVAWRNAGTLSAALVPLVGTAPAPVTLGTGMPEGTLDVMRVDVAHFLVVAGWTPGPLTTFMSYDVTSTSTTPQLLLDAGTWLGVDVTPCVFGACLLARAGTTSPQVSGLWLDAGVVGVLQPPMPARTNDWDVASNPAGTQLVETWAASGNVNAIFTQADFTPLIGRVLLSNEPAPSVRPSLAASGDVMLIAWVVPTATGSKVLGRRYANDGTAIDALPIDLGTAAPGYDRVEVLPTAAGWIVAMPNTNARTSLVRLPRAGGPLAEREIALEAYDQGFALAGDRLLIAQKYWTGTVWDPLLVMVDADGGVESTLLQLTPPKEHATNVAVGLNGWLAVWRDPDPLGMSDGILAGVHLGLDGVVLDDGGLRFTPPGAESMIDDELVSDGLGGFIVVWHSYSSLWTQSITDSASPPVRVFPDSNALVAQHKLAELGAATAVVVYVNQSDGGVLAQTVAVDGGGMSVDAPVLVSESGFNAWPNVVVTPGFVWFAYDRADTTQNSMGLYARRFARGGLGAACSSAWQCQSGVCRAGACTDAPPVGGGGGATGGGSGAGGGAPAGGGSAPGGGAGGGGGGTEPMRGQFTVGLGCTSGGGELVGWLVLLALRRAVVTRRSCRRSSSSTDA